MTPVVPERPGALALAPDGGLYVTDRTRVLERRADGTFVVKVTGLRNPGGLAVAADGTLYVADTGDNRVVRVSPRGGVATVAGNGHGGWTPNGAMAVRAPLLSPTAVAIDRNGRLTIAASGWGEVLRLEPDGRLTRLAGDRQSGGVVGIGGPATDASGDGADGLAYDRDGNLFLAGFNTKSLLMIDTHGRMRLPAGRRPFYPRGQGALAAAPDGRVLAAETQSIEELTPRGVRRLFSFAGRRVGRITGFLPAGVAVSRSGVIYTDTAYGNGWSNGSAIVAIRSGRIRVLWSHR